MLTSYALVTSFIITFLAGIVWNRSNRANVLVKSILYAQSILLAIVIVQRFNLLSFVGN